jgi:uncharacterized membrane protein YeaQ/YmgE (transglycosylase-associated protein family)
MTKTNRWYREPIMWLVVAFPLTSVIVGFVSLALAIRSDDGMVEDITAGRAGSTIACWIGTKPPLRTHRPWNWMPRVTSCRCG